MRLVRILMKATLGLFISLLLTLAVLAFFPPALTSLLNGASKSLPVNSDLRVLKRSELNKVLNLQLTNQKQLNHWLLKNTPEQDQYHLGFMSFYYQKQFCLESVVGIHRWADVNFRYQQVDCEPER